MSRFRWSFLTRGVFLPAACRCIWRRRRSRPPQWNVAEALEDRSLLAFSVLNADLFSTGGLRLVADLNQPVDASTVQASDLVVDGTQVAMSVNVLDVDTVEFVLPTLLAGTHSADIVAGAMLDTQGTGVDSFTESFAVASAPQYTMKHNPRLQPGNAPLVGYAGSELDRVDLLWQTIPGGTGTQDSFSVQYSAAGSTTWQTVSLNVPINTGVEGRVVRSATITGLDWNSDYEYRVLHRQADVIVGQYASTFRTRLPAGDDTPFTFVAYGDSAIGMATGFRQVQSRINQVDPSFAVLLGDNVYNSGSHQQSDSRFDPIVNPEAAAWMAGHIDYLGLGNHDLGTKSGLPSEQNYSVPIPLAGVTAPAAPPPTERPEHSYSWDYGDVHFVTFDTNSLSNLTRLDRLLHWVVADLNASTARWKIVYGHHPLAGVPDKPENPGENYYQQVVNRLKAAGVDLFMTGHSHTYSRTYPLTGQINGVATYAYHGADDHFHAGEGLPQLVSGVGGKEIREGDYSQFPFVAEGFTSTTPIPARLGFSQIIVTQDRLTVSYIAADNSAVIDSFVIVKDPAPQTVSFQQGIRGYTGTVDTFLHQNAPDTDNAAATSLTVDNDDPVGTGRDAQALLRFDDLFGSGAEQIPLNATLRSARLQLQVTNGSVNNMNLHRMIGTWSAADTWNTLANGLQTDDVEAVTSPDTSTGQSQIGELSFNVLASLQAWQASPTSNFGWVMVPTGKDSVEFNSSEGTTPPKLIVTYVVDIGPNEPPVATNDTVPANGSAAVTFSVLSNDTDTNGDALSVLSVTTPAHGSVVMNADGTVTYMPASGYFGPDTFDYTISDGRGGTATASATVTPPDILMNSVTANGETTLTVQYQIRNVPVTSPLSLRYLRSTDTLADGSDTFLCAVTINTAADLTVGTHTLDFTIGSQVLLPGSGTPELASDYFILAVADQANAITETDSDPLSEDNTAVFVGAYATSAAIYLHGGAAADTVTLTYPTTTSGDVTLGLSGSLSATVTYVYDSTAQFRVRTHDGNDIVNTANSANLTARPMFELGGDGNDLLNGAAGEDSLDGSAGNDSLRGGAGNDTLEGGAGTNTLIASGNLDFTLTNTSLTAGATDTLANLQVARLTGGSGSNTFTVSEWTGAGLLLGGGGTTTDTIVASKDVDFTLSNTRLQTSDGMNLSLGGFTNATLTGGAGNNTFKVDGWTGTGTLEGGAGTDSLRSTRDANQSLTTTSLVATGFGTLMLSDIESARLTGGAGNNIFALSGWTGAGTLTGGGGVDEVVASQDADCTLSDTKLTASNGLSMTLAGIAIASLDGGVSDNIFTVGAWTGTGTLNGGTGTDTVRSTRDAHQTLTATSLVATDFGTLTLSDIESARLTGSASNNTFTVSGWTGTGTLTGGGGSDEVVASQDTDVTLSDSKLTASNGLSMTLVGIGIASLGGGVSDNTFAVGAWTGTGTLDGGTGTDTLRSTRDADQTLTTTSLVATGFGTLALSDIESARLTGGVSNNTINASAFDGLVTLSGSGGDDSLTGTTSLGSLLNGDDGNDTLVGGNLHDTLNGGAGSDSLTGGAGNDKLSGQDGDGDSLMGGTGNDTLDGGNGLGDTLIALGNVNFTLTNSQLTSSATDSLFGIEAANLTGGAGDNTLDAGAFTGNVTLIGGAGNDTLIGSSGDDSLRGDVGSDSLKGRDGNDLLKGGNDFLSTGADDDTLNGGNGNDTLLGGIGSDALSGYSGNDALNGGAGNDTLYGGDGNDQLLGGGGNDILLGGNEDDTLNGQGGTDTLTGDAGTNVFIDMLDQIEGFEITPLPSWVNAP